MYRFNRAGGDKTWMCDTLNLYFSTAEVFEVESWIYASVYICVCVRVFLNTILYKLYDRSNLSVRYTCNKVMGPRSPASRLLGDTPPSPRLHETLKMCFFNKDSGEQANLIAASSKHTKGIGIRCSPDGSDSSGWPRATVIPLGCLVNVNGMSIKCAVELARADWCSLVEERRKRKGQQERTGLERKALMCRQAPPWSLFCSKPSSNIHPHPHSLHSQPYHYQQP